MSEHSNDEVKSQLRSFRNRYSILFPLPTVGAKSQSILLEILSKVDFKRPLFICCDIDFYKPVFVTGLLSIQKPVDFELFSAQDLTDIWHARITEEDGRPKSFSTIRAPVVGIYMGYSELPNKSLSYPLEQMLSLVNSRGGLRFFKDPVSGLPRKEGQVMWFFYKGSFDNFKTKFPDLFNQMKEMDFQFTNLPFSKSKTSSSGSLISTTNTLEDRKSNVF